MNPRINLTSYAFPSTKALCPKSHSPRTQSFSFSQNRLTVTDEEDKLCLYHLFQEEHSVHWSLSGFVPHYFPIAAGHQIDWICLVTPMKQQRTLQARGHVAAISWYGIQGILPPAVKCFPCGFPKGRLTVEEWRKPPVFRKSQTSYHKCTVMVKRLQSKRPLVPIKKKK